MFLAEFWLKISYHYFEEFDLQAVIRIYNEFMRSHQEGNEVVMHNDVCFLGDKRSEVRLLDECLTRHGRRTQTNFEDAETYRVMYNRVGLNVLTDAKQRKRAAAILDRELYVVRQTKKINFQRESGCLKLCTIHSFKGWEIRAVFLILGAGALGVEAGGGAVSADAAQEEQDLLAAELVYTGITRAKEFLFIINIGHREYDKVFREFMESA